jgi:hypothetical protein
MGKLNVSIYGLAMCHFDEEKKVWNAFFPKVEDHFFRMTVRTITNSGTEYAKESVSEYKFLSTETITVKAKSEPGESSFGELNEMIDLSKLIAKEDGIVIRKTDESLYSAFLMLQGFQLNQMSIIFNNDGEFRETEEHNKYTVWETSLSTRKNPTPERISAGEIAVRSALKSSDVETETGQQTIVASNSFELIINHADDIDYEISFDNHCYKSPEECAAMTASDFKFYYNILEESSVKFVELEIPPGSPQPGQGFRSHCDTVITTHLRP